MKKNLKKILYIYLVVILAIVLIAVVSILNHEIIPDGGKYITVSDEVLNAGDTFPMFIRTGDRYYYGNYEYCYNMHYTLVGFPHPDDNPFSFHSSGFSLKMTWVKKDFTEPAGWGVHIVNKEQESCGIILDNINGKPVIG